MFKRAQFDLLKSRIEEPRQFIQVITGPRQVGKTTLVQQLLETIDIPYHFASGDEVITGNIAWIDQQWELARIKLKQTEGAKEFLLVIDEIQKIKAWSTSIKRHWDHDSRLKINIKVILLGSARLLLEEGLTESLAGRFERIYMSHWSFTEMREAFDLSLEEYVWFGGYPGAITLRNDEQRWKNYVRDALIETTISKDILQLNRIYKPALLKRLFEFSCIYSSKILSYNKMLGQLQDAGNTTTLSHYLHLLESAGMVMGLQNYSGSMIRTKASSPKLQVLNTAFLTVYQSESYQQLRLQTDRWGQHIESAIGAHLANQCTASDMELLYWRKGDDEVDFVLKRGDKVIGIEVKSSASKFHIGASVFKGLHHPHKVLLVGEGGISVEEFLKLGVGELF